jgi:hypothetical protein
MRKFYLEEGKESENNFPTLYRYESSSFSGQHLALWLSKFKVVKETPQGWWISRDGYGWEKNKWVAKHGIKRFAYPTKELALESFIKRKTKMIQKLKNSLACTEIILGIAERVASGDVTEEHKEINPLTRSIYWDPYAEEYL